MRFVSFLPILLLAACASTSVTPSQSVVKSERVEPETQVLNTVQADPAFARTQRFEAWREDFTRRAIAKGYSPTLLARTVGQARINERAIERNSNQPEQRFRHHHC